MEHKIVEIVEGDCVDDVLLDGRGGGFISLVLFFSRWTVLEDLRTE